MVGDGWLVVAAGRHEEAIWVQTVVPIHTQVQEARRRNAAIRAQAKAAVEVAAQRLTDLQHSRG